MVQLEEQVSVAPEALKDEGIERLRGSQGLAIIEELKKIGVIVAWKEYLPPVLHVTVEDRVRGIAEVKMRTARAMIEGFLTDKVTFDKLVIGVFLDLKIAMSRDFHSKIEELIKAMEGKQEATSAP